MNIPEIVLISTNDLFTPRQCHLLQKLGILTAEDLLTFFPFRYEDRSQIMSIADLVLSQENATIKAVVVEHQHFFYNNKRQTKIIIKDQSASAELVPFNLRGADKSFPIGQELYIYGKFEFRFNKIQSTQFEFETPEKFSSDLSVMGKIYPIYRLTEGLTQREFHKLIKKTLNYCIDKIVEPIPDYFLKSRNLFSKKECLTYLHFPATLSLIEKSRIRGAYEEFLSTRLSLELKRLNERKQVKNHTYNAEGIIDQLKNILPFSMTNAQIRVISEIKKDLQSVHSMHRLVQGDVGSGKTTVALAAMLLAAMNGLQTAFLVPTEVLAFQHYKKISSLCEQLQIPCALLTGSLTTKERMPILEGLKKGTLPILIGTHAIFQREVIYHNLSLVVIDEQHKFGVEQRGALIAKGKNVDILVMTATPIPRTITLSLYGDLDISVIDELPSGRQEIITKHIKEKDVPNLVHKIEEQLLLGRQMFVVCPLIEENEKLENIRSVEQVQNDYTQLFPNYKVELIHGKMSQQEKDLIMKKFSECDIHILVSTTVIEVGIDIPNATIMLIENAERFGLAQLHQLRGRVGRGSYQSFCFAINRSYDADYRLNIFASTTDGFKIAEEDLKLRGPGEVLGTKQTGTPIFKIANFMQDQKILQAAVNDAQLIIQKDPLLQLPQHNRLKKFITENQEFRVFSG